MLDWKPLCIRRKKHFKSSLISSDIYPRVKGEEFTEVQDDDATITFITDLGYKGPLHKYTSMENIDYPELIWEDFVFQIDHKRENKSRRETMPFPRFTKVIINHFLSQHKSLSKLKFQHYHTIKDDGIESIDVSDESEPEPAKKKTGSRSIRGVVIQDTPKQEDADIMQALKESKKTSRRQPSTGGSSEGTGRIPGVPDESTIVSATSSEGTGTKLGVPNEEKVISEENVILEWGSEHESEHSEDSQLNSDEEEKKDNDSDADDEDEEDDHVSDSQDTDDEDVEIESDEDEIYKYKIQVHKDVDVEMKEAETVKCENKEKVEMTDATKADVEKTTKEKGDAELARNAMASNYQVKESTEFPLPSSSLSLSSGFGTHFLNLFFDVSLTVTPTILIVQQRTTPIPTPPITTKASTISITVPEFDALTAIQLRVAKLEKDVSELKKIDHSVEVLALLKSQVLTVLEYYLGSKIGDDLQKVLQRHTADLIQKYSVKPALESSKIQSPTVDLEQESEKSASEIRKVKKELAEKKKMPKYTIKSTNKAALKEYDQKSALYQTMHENKSFIRNPANHALYHALMEALIED
ncbi:retrovirus-related pol polyprotein from transposon TNT 1-94 [Tanacetum coccineum]